MKRVYMFSTCLGTALMGKTVTNAISLLQREGIEVVFKKDQTCCGQPSFNTGYFDETKKVALYNARLFDKDYPIVVPSGSCAGMMMHDYLELFEGDKEYEFMKEFGSRVFELSVYLDKILNVQYEDKGDPIKVTWHSNCHALRVAKSIESSKNRVDGIPKTSGANLVHMNYEEQLKFKKKKVQNVMDKVLGKDSIEVLDTLGMEDGYHYRNKSVIPVQKVNGEVKMGYYKPRSHEVVNIEKCFIQYDEHNILMN